MTFDKLNRRAHLYLGIVLTPWFLLYALSGFVLNHGSWFQNDKNAPEWTRRFDHIYRLPPIIEDQEEALAEKLLKDHGLLGRYRVSTDDDGKLIVDRIRLLSIIRLTYYAKEGRLVAEEQRPRLDRLLTAAHFRAGFEYPYALEWLWGTMVDLLVVATLIWIASGLWLWWKLRRFRFWGGLALLAGVASFVLLVLGL
jgi:hypothetical protein